MSKFFDSLQSALDALALLKTKLVAQDPPKSWFNNGITQQKYRSEPTWLSLKVERHKLHNAIYLAKKDHTSDLLVSCGNDSGKLYKLVNHLMGVSGQIHYSIRIQKFWLKNLLISFLIKLQPYTKILHNTSPIPVRSNVTPVSSNLNP